MCEWQISFIKAYDYDNDCVHWGNMGVFDINSDDKLTIYRQMDDRDWIFISNNSSRLALQRKLVRGKNVYLIMHACISV